VELCFLCMALSSSEIYRLNVYQLREECVKFGLDSTGPVRSLRPRLLKRLRRAAMAENQDNENVKASGSADLSLDPFVRKTPFEQLSCARYE